MADNAVGRRAVSVVTVTRNNLAGLQQTCASLADQEFKDVQHIVIDGASTDGSQAWLATNRATLDTTVISEPDLGAYDAMNKGARLATGKILNFLNAGDRYASPSVLHRVVESHAARSWGWAFALARVIGSDGNAVRPVRPITYSLRRHALGLISIPHQATFMETNLFQSLGGFDLRYRLAADTDLLLRAGQISPPEVSSTVDVLYAAGGSSDRGVYRLIYEKHLIRRRIPGLCLGPPIIDLGWAAAQVGTVAVRKVGKWILVLVSGGRFQRWWATRGL